MTASRLVLGHSTHHLGQTLVEQIRHVQSIKFEEYKVKNEENKDILKKIMQDGQSCVDKHGGTTDNIQKWNVKDITLLLRTYRRKQDKPLPTKKKELVDLYNSWKGRPKTNYNGRVDIDLTIDHEENTDTSTSSNDAVTTTTTRDEKANILLAVTPEQAAPVLPTLDVPMPSTATVEHIDFDTNVMM